MKRTWIWLSLLVLLTGLLGPAAGAQGPDVDPPDPAGGTCSTGVPPGDIDFPSPYAAWPGPDGYGYLGQTTAYDWIDISASGVPLYLNDNDQEGPLPIGFGFPFYGSTWSHFYVSSNGFISFGTGSADSGNDCPLPHANAPDNLIALMWDDLDPGDTDDPVYYETFASCPRGAGPCLVVQYDNYHHAPGGGAIAGTFEAILYQSGTIIIQFADTGAEQGAESTTGLEGADAASDYGLTYACDLPGSLNDGLALWFGFALGVMAHPDWSFQEGCAEETVEHRFTVRSFTGLTETFSIAYSWGLWPVVGPSTIGPIPDGGSAFLDIAVDIPAGTPAGTCDQTTIGILADSSGYTTTVVAETCARLGGQWQDRAPSSFPVMDNVYVEYQGQAYLVGGYGAEGSVGIYDPFTDSWRSGSPEPAPHIVSPMDGCLGLNDVGEPVVVLFPNMTPGVNTLHRYNVANDSWDTPPVPDPFPAGGIWAMEIVSLYNLTGDNVCYLTGGATTGSGGDLSLLYRYEPATNTMVDLGDYTHHPAGFDFHAAWYVPWVGPAGGICVAGGVDASNTAFPDTQCYDLAVHTFNPPNADLGALPIVVWGMADAWLQDGVDYQLWLANGSDAGENIWQHSLYYSVRDGAWAYGPDPLYGAYRLEADNLAGYLYLSGGSVTNGFTPGSDHDRLGAGCPPPAGWLSGVVRDLETGCTLPPCTPAHVRVNPIGLNVPVDGSGAYTVSLPGAEYAVYGGADGYAFEGPYTVTVPSATVVYQDFCLAHPVVAAEPPGLQASALPSTFITLTLSISNTGHAALDFFLQEMTTSLPVDLPWVWQIPPDGTVPPSTTLPVEVVFMCTPADAGVLLTGTLQIEHNDPCQDALLVALEMDCLVPCDPVVDPDFEWWPFSPAVGQAVIFTGTVEGTPPVTFTWDFGDGVIATGQVVSHTYMDSGVYTVTMTAHNCVTDTASVAYSLTVRPCVPVLAADFTWTPLTPTAGEAFILTGTAYSSGTVWALGPIAAEGSADISLAVDAAGRPHLGYFSADMVRYAYLDGSGWFSQTVDSLGLMGGGVSLALDGAGYPHLSYYNDNIPAMRHAYYNGSSWTIETVESAGHYVGLESSLALDDADRAHISYYDEVNGDLKYAYYDGTGWQIEVVDGDGPVGRWSSLALDGAGWPHVSYSSDAPDYALKYAYYDGVSWQVEVLGQGVESSLALDGADRPHVGYQQGWVPGSQVVYAYHDGLAWITSTVVEGESPSLELDPSGSPGVALRDSADQALRYAYYDGSGWALELVDGGRDFWSPALALDGDAQPHVVYYDATDGLLRYARRLHVSPTPPLSYIWDMGDGAVVSGAHISHIYAQGGDYTVTMTASNACGLAVAALDLHVCSPVSGATFTWQPPLPTVGETVTFTAAASGTQPISFCWDWGDGAGSVGTTVSHTFASGGDYLVTVTATNACGQELAAYTVSVCAPAESPSFLWLPAEPAQGALITFSAQASGTQPLSFLWQLGDGVTASGRLVTHVYANPGPYTVTLWARNACGEAQVARAVDVIQTRWQIYLPLVLRGYED